MPTSTARGQFPYPLGTDNWKLIEDYLRALAERNAAVSALYVESTAATRPAPGTPGRLHRATDTGTVTWDTGTAWDDVAVSRAGGSTITASAPAVRPLTVKAAASQTANLQEWQNSAGTVLANVRADGAIGVGTTSTTTDHVLTTHENNTVQVNGGGLRVNGANSAAAGLVVRGAASQTANLAEFQNSAGTVLTGVDSVGRLAFQANVDGTALGAYAGRIAVVVNGVTRYLPFYA